jgi:hypothetical protein
LKELLIKVFIYDGSSFIDQFPAILCSSKRLIETAGTPFIARDSHTGGGKKLLKVRGGFNGVSQYSPIRILLMY